MNVGDIVIITEEDWDDMGDMKIGDILTITEVDHQMLKFKETPPYMSIHRSCFRLLTPLELELL